MPRVIGIDPGTVSFDLCGLDDGDVFLVQSLPTADALADPSVILDILSEAGPLDLVAGPSGYGVPLSVARDLTDADLRLAFLAAAGESGGIGGLRTLLRALARSAAPVVFTPGVIHLRSVPPHRKVNRVDMGTAEKVCAAALAIHERAIRRDCPPGDVSLILLELGGAFTAALAVDGGRIVDGLGGTSGPMGARAAGAIDGEVAYLAGTVSKAMLFRGGVSDAAAAVGASIAWAAFHESIVKAVAALLVSAPQAREIVISGRLAHDAAVREGLLPRLERLVDGRPIHALEGFATGASHAAQGAALVADGLAGGSQARLVETLGIREASGTVLDHLAVITPEAARRRIGLEPE